MQDSVDKISGEHRRQKKDFKGIPNSELLTGFKKVHGNKYEYNTDTKPYGKRSGRYITIKCPEHGTFIQRVSDHLKGHGCRACGYDKMLDTRRTQKIQNMTEEERVVPHLFYKVKFTHKKSALTFVKIGITSNSIRERFSSEYKDYEIEVLDVLSATYKEVLLREAKFIQMFSKHKFKFPENITKFDGYTECYNLSVLSANPENPDEEKMI